MRILYIDIDTLRPDHLGCYGYHRATSPNIDRLAAQGVRLDRCYTSDSPCLPSRSALISGRFGIHNGAISHGGTTADPFLDGAGRSWNTRLAATSWAMRMRAAGLYTATISSFGERHSAYHWYAGFNEVLNVGKRGIERADEVLPLAAGWLERHGRQEDWFLHVHLWDPHTPYRTPADYGEPFAESPLPEWLTEDVRGAHWRLPGPHSAQEVTGFSDDDYSSRFPRQPVRMDSMAEVRKMMDGYDTGVRYADDHVGRLVGQLADLGVLGETAVMVSGDHGETLGELAIYGDHQTADEHTHRLPMILRWPGLPGGRTDSAFHYQIDVAATVLELLGAEVPPTWDGESFAESLRAGAESGRDHLVLSQGAWTAQRSVRSGPWLCIRTYHDGYHGFPEVMLFDVEADPHEREDVAAKNPEVVADLMAKLAGWHAAAMMTSATDVDPMWTLLREGGPFHVRGELPAYLERLRATGREEWAERFATRGLDVG